MEIYAKRSKPKVAEEPWLKFNPRYLPCQTRVVEGHVSLPSVMGDRQAQQRGTVVRCRSSEEPKIWNSPLKSVLPAHDEDWRKEAAQGMLKHFLRTHKSLFNVFPLARSSSGGGDYFLLPTLKKMQKPPSLCSFSLRCLLMTRMPVCNSLNNYRQDREEAASEWWNVDFIISVAKECVLACSVDMKKALLLPGGPWGDMLFMYPACYVIDSVAFDLWVLQRRA